METKVCAQCGGEFPIKKFRIGGKPNKDGSRYRDKVCRSCRMSDPIFAERLRKNSRESTARAVVQIKAKVLAHYGGKCSCCGEAEACFLTIDHINGGGKKHRGEVGHASKFYKWLMDNDYPAEFRILCWNCNCGRQMNGGICPHERGRSGKLAIAP